VEAATGLPPPPKQKEEEKILRSLKIRMLPTAAQKKALQTCFAAARTAYNFANDLVRHHEALPFAEKLRDAWSGWKEELRLNRFGDSHRWRWLVQSGVHNKIEAQAIRQLAAAYASIRARKQNLRAAGERTFESTVQFRSYRRQMVETLHLEKGATAGPLLQFVPAQFTCRRRKFARCVVRVGGDIFKRDVKEEEVQPTVRKRKHNNNASASSAAKKKSKKEDFGGILLEDKQSVIERLVHENKPLHDGKVVWDKRLNTFHFIYLYEVRPEPDPDPAFEHKRVVAMDPGVSPFQAWYSPTSGEHGKLLEHEEIRLHARCLQLDKLRSRLDKHRGARTRRRTQRWRTRHRLRRRFARECKRLRGWVEAAHYSCINLILGAHDLIIQPVLETARLSRRSASRNIHSKTVRSMNTWSHFQYRQRLKSATVRYAGRHIIESTEPGTSKTCTNCGCWKAELRVRDKIYECNRCRIVVDRQIAGARNNFFAAYGVAVGVGWDGMGI